MGFMLKLSCKISAEQDSAYKISMFHANYCIAIHVNLTRIFHELQSRDREDGRVTGQPQELGPEAYLNSTSQGSRSEDDRRTAISAVAVGHS